MATLEVSFLQGQLEERKRRLEVAVVSTPRNSGLTDLLREVDSALGRVAEGTYGLCVECHDPVERELLLADPLARYCLDHLTQSQRAALQRDLDLASKVQRNLLPQKGLRAGGWETSYHFAPVGAVSGDYCDLIPSDGQLLFLLGDVSGKGVAASMLMAQLHALFRSLTGMSLPLGQIVSHVNRFFCECALAGQYATLVCGLAKPTGEVEIHNAGHCPAIVFGRSGVFCIEPTGLPLGMFLETKITRDYDPPIIEITESGCGYLDSPDEEMHGRIPDTRRILWYRETLAELARAIAAGARVRAFHDWTLLDNFQWAEGYTERYGLIYTDFRNQKRTIKDSGYWYGRVAASNRLDV